MKNLACWIAGLYILTISGASIAATTPTTITNISPGMIGLEIGGNQAFVQISPATANTGGCLNNGVYFSITSYNSNALAWTGAAWGQITDINFPAKAEAVAASAKMAGKLLRMDYGQPGGSGTACYGYSIYVL